MIVEKKNRILESPHCNECGGSGFVENPQKELVCTGCGLVYTGIEINLSDSTNEYISDSKFSSAMTRSRERGNDGFLEHAAPTDKGIGTTFYTRPGQGDIYRLKIRQNKELRNNNSKKVRNNKKRKNVLKGAESAFRNIKLPQKIKPLIYKLFGEIATELNFPDAKARFYAAALVWWYTDTYTVTNITIHSITRDIKKTVESTTIKLEGDALIVCSKLKALFVKYKSGHISADFVREKVGEMNQKYPSIFCRLKNVPAEPEASKGQIVECLGEGIASLKNSFGHSVNHINRRISKYRKEIEGTKVIKRLTKERRWTTVDDHIEKNCDIIEPLNIVTRLQLEILKKTAMKISDSIRIETSGKSRHTVAVTSLWIALMYHGIRLTLPYISKSLNSSKSTLGSWTRKLQKILGFKKTDAIGTYGYLSPVRKNSFLYKLGDSYLFTETADDVKKEIAEEITLLSRSSSNPEYVAARFLVVKELILRERASEEELREALGKALEGADHRYLSVSKDHIKWYGIKVNGKGTLISGRTKLIEHNGDVFYLSARYKGYISPLFSSCSVFIERCVMGRFQRSRCENALETLVNTGGEVTESEAATKGRGSPLTVEELVITLKTENKDMTYTEIGEAVLGHFPKETRNMRNVIYKILSKNNLVDRKK